MDKQIQDILNDIYKIDESFRAYEKDLIKIINKILDSRPIVKIDEAFVNELRTKVMADAKKGGEVVNQESWIANFMNAPKYSYALVGAVITLVLVVPLMQFINRPNIKQTQLSLDLSKGPKIAKLSDNAFGSLVGPTPAPTNESQGVGSGEGAVFSEESIEADDAVISPKMLEGGGGGGLGAVTDSRMIGMPAPEIINYKYQYVGDSFNLEGSEVSVYQRTKDDTISKQVARSLKDVNLGLFNSGKLQNTMINSLQIAEDREYGYSVYYNFFDNSLSISSNWEKWPRDDRVYEPLGEGDVPPDNSLIKIADQFLANYGISTDGYAEPVVNHYWKNQRGFMEGDFLYVPEIIQVVYPTKLEGQIVYDEGGQPSGLTVDVNIRENRAQGAHGLVIQSYNKSSYPAVSDVAKVIETAEKGGRSWLYENPEAKETQILKLGNPERKLVRQWHYDSGQGKGGEELYVPALVFPIVNLDEAPNFWGQSVVVPLVQEIFDQINQIFPPGIPEPMPLLRTESAPAIEPMIEDIEETEDSE